MTGFVSTAHLAVPEVEATKRRKPWEKGGEIRQRREQDLAILSIEDALLSELQVAPFHDEIRDLQIQDVNKFVVVLSCVTWFGSAMFGVLVASLTTVKKSRA